MNWETKIDKNGYITVFGNGDELQIETILNEVCQKIQSELFAINTIEWDYLIFEFWLDSGRMIIYPQSNNSRRRVEKGAIVVTSNKLLEIFDLPFNNITDEDAAANQEIANEFDLACGLCKSLTFKKKEIREVTKKEQIRLRFYTAETFFLEASLYN